MRELLLVRKLEEEQAKRKPRDTPPDSASIQKPSDITDSVDTERSIQSQNQDSPPPENNHDQLPSTSQHSANHIEGNSLSDDDLVHGVVEAVDSSKLVDSIEGANESDAYGLTTGASADNESKMNKGSTELQSKPLDSNFENVEIQSSSPALINSYATDGTVSNSPLEKSNQVEKEQPNQGTDDNISQNKLENSDLLSKDDPIESTKSVKENIELSPDEKRQRLAATRSTQRKELKSLMRQKKLQKQSEEVDVVIMEPTKKPTVNDDAQVSNDPPTVLIDSAEKEEKTASSRIKRSKAKSSSSADYDSDGSVDLDVLIAENSDLDSGAMQLNDDGLNDDDDNFWNIDPAELERHLTPSTTPLRLPSPDPQSPPTMFSSVHVSRPFSMIAEEDENLSDTPLEVDGQEADDILNSFSSSNGFNIGSKEDEDEEEKIDMMLDAQSLLLFLQLLQGLHLLVTLRNLRQCQMDRLRAPSRAGSHMTIASRIATGQSTPAATPIRSRSMSAVSNSSTEESTTSSIGATSPSRIASPTRGIHMSMYNAPPQSKSGSNGRPRSTSRISNSSAEEVLVRPTSTYGMRPLSRAGSHIGATKSSGITQSRIQDSVHSASIASTKASSSTRSISQSQPHPTGLMRPSSRASTVKSPIPPPTTPGRPLSRFGSLSESQKNTPTKKSRPQSLSVINQSIKYEQPSNIDATIGQNSMSGIRSPSSGLRTINYLGSRQSSDSLSSHDEYLVFTPPESPTGASETDSLTSLTSSVSYGSSPGRGTSPVPPYNTSMISPASVISPNSSKRASMISKLPASKVPPSKLMAPNSISAGQNTSIPTGLRIPQAG
ncbi:9841_t:CDS:2, partial [Acaulospora colombiana]